MSLLNLSWDASDPTLFLSQKVGLADFINIAHPQLEKLALKQRSQYWIETEVKMADDTKMWPQVPESYRLITLENLAWQTMTDSFIARAPEQSIQPLVSRPELEGMIKEWGYFENIHSRAYSNIIQTVLPDPALFIRSIVDNQEAFARIAGAVGFFDELYRASRNWEDTENPTTAQYEKMQQMLLEAYLHIYALESIQFYASFACTFALAEEDVFTGIANNLQLIAKDEALHTHMSKEVILIHMSQMKPHLVEEVMEKAPQILWNVVQREIAWGNYILRDGRSLSKLQSPDELTNYLFHIGYVSFNFLGIDMPNGMEIIRQNPLLFMDNYLDPDRFQVAPQETSVTSYRVGQTTQGSASDWADLEGLM